MSVGSILPSVRYADPAEAADWLCSAYGFSIHHVAKRSDGATAYIVLRLGENSVVVAPYGSSAFDDLWVQPADDGGGSTPTCYLTVQDLDRHCAHALRTGARLEVGPSDDGTGGRFYTCRDPQGYLWNFGERPARLTSVDLDCPSQRPGRYSVLSGATINLAVLVGCGAMFYLGTDLATKALTAWDGMSGTHASSVSSNTTQKASATKRFLVSEAAALDLTETLQISQFELAEAPQSKPSDERPPDASDAEYQSRLKDTQGALDAAVQAKELASRELEAERRRAEAIQTLLDEASQQLARLRADGSRFEMRLKDSQGALDAAVRAKELAARELEAERHRAQAIQAQLEEASRQLSRLRADGSTFELEARRLRDVMARLGNVLPGSTQIGDPTRDQRAAAQGAEQLLLERLRASEREARELELRARMAILEMDKEAASLRAEQAAESARTALAADRADQLGPHDKLRAGAPATADAPGRVTAKEPAKDVVRVMPRQSTGVPRRAALDTKVNEGTPGAPPRAAVVRPLPQHRLTQNKTWISVASIKKKAELRRQMAEAAAAARKAEEERQRAAAEAAQKAEAERKRQVAEAAAAARKAEEERQRAAAEAAQKAEAERKRQMAEAAAAARKAEEERQRAAAEAAQKAEAERKRQVAEAAAAARKVEEERQRAAAEAAQKAEVERKRQVAEAAAAARKAEEERQRAATEAAQKAEAERIVKEAAVAKTRAAQNARRQALGFTVTSEDGARFLARGRALLATGDVTSARLFLERASNAGLADAAMELAETYDPATLTRLSAVGLVSDREQARVWYMRAQALGSSAAAERLKSIVGQ